MKPEVIDLGDGGFPERPEWMYCDCCVQRSDRLWYYQHSGFCIQAFGRRVEFRESAWAFCVYCRPLKDDALLLTARVVSFGGYPLEWLRLLFSVLAMACYGEPKYWESGRLCPRAGVGEA